VSNKRARTVPVKRPQKPARTVCVAFIHPGETSAYFTTSLLASMLYDQASDRHIVAIINEWSSANVSAARNTLTRIFLEEKTAAEWLLFIDADMGWDHDAIHQLIESADPVERPIVGGLCFGARAGRLFPTIYQLTQVDGRPTTVRVDDFEPDALVKCAATGAAFLLIHRDVIAAMRDKQFNAAFPWFQETELAGQPAGEDITFGLRAGILGYPVHVNTAVHIGHHKSQLLTTELYQQQKAGADVDSHAG
jgi:hypothetical protein